jgi:signal transduction histidine kinase
MSDRKALMDNLRRHTDELELRVRERDQSNAELEAFAYSVSHDLRAPLRAITGFAEALADECGGRFDDAGRDYLNEIVSAAGRMNVMVQDLLEYSRVGRINMPLASVNVLNAINNATRQLGDVPVEALKVEVSATLFVCGHEQILTQVISNLLSNALKFRRKDVAPEILITAERRNNNNSVRLSVKDNGIGIAPEHQDRIWNVFERLHDRETYTGTGIGLAIVKRAIIRMNGTTGLLSKPGAGSTFWIELPIDQTK